MQIVDAAAHLEEVERIVHELLGRCAGLEWAVIEIASPEAPEARSDRGTRVFILKMEFDQRRETEPHAVGVGLGECFAQHAVEQETGFEIGAGWRVLDAADTLAQIQSLGLL